MTSTDVPVPSGPESPLTLTARSPEDLLALAPVVLGFVPTESVVMLTFGAVAPFHARIDLPGSEHLVGEVVDALVAPALRHRVERVVLLVYGEDRHLVDRLWSELAVGFAAAGIDVIDALRTAGNRWYPLVGRDARTRRVGVAVDLSAHPFLVQAIVDGRVTHRSRAALAATLLPDPAAVDRLSGLVHAVPAVVDHEAEGVWIESLLVRQLAEGALPQEREVARLLVALVDVRLREVAWRTITRPHARAAVAWWTHVVTRCPGHLVAGPAALLAWSAWLHGNGALAWCALDRCEAAQPGHSLALIVADLLEAAQPPSSWRDVVEVRSALDATARAG